MLHLVVGFRLVKVDATLGGASSLVKVDATLGGASSLVKVDATLGGEVWVGQS